MWGIGQEGECGSGTHSAFYICGSAIQVKKRRRVVGAGALETAEREKLCA